MKIHFHRLNFILNRDLKNESSFMWYFQELLITSRRHVKACILNRIQELSISSNRHEKNLVFKNAFNIRIWWPLVIKGFTYIKYLFLFFVTKQIKHFDWRGIQYFINRYHICSGGILHFPVYMLLSLWVSHYYMFVYRCRRSS